MKCGLSNIIDGSEDLLVNIRGVEGYKMPNPENEFHLASSSESNSKSDEYEEGTDCYSASEDEN